jgi:lysophospholipase L1-like esterase
MLTPETAPRRALRLLAASALFLLSVLMALKLALMLVKGDAAAWSLWHGKGLFYAGHPLRYLFVGSGALLGGWVLLRLRRNGAREWAQLAGKLALLAFSVLLTLAAGEIAVRVYLLSQSEINSLDHLKKNYRAGKKPEVHTTHPMSSIIRPSDDPHIVYDLQPDLVMDFGHHWVRTNHDGLRSDKNYPLARQPNSVRIVGVGDSGMFGWDVEQNEPYMAVLEANLNRRGDGTAYEALNFAVPGYNTQLEAETLRRKALAYRPDVVIVGWCENDFSLPFFMLEHVNFRRRDISYLYRLLFDRKTYLEEASGVRFTEMREFNEKDVMPEITGGADVAGVRRALQDMQEMSRTHDFHLLIFGPLGPEILRLCHEVGVDYYNTFEKIAGGIYPDNFAIHFMHPRPGGHRVLAEYLERELAARGWLKPRARGAPPAGS